ncbi:MAG: NAD(P)/FAD-dependent oxidoreductase [Coriobacteriia bacterium]|nr:NAD(P)/FAD-dependent oxidoreductase [Coriobacteriia bacterium]
MEHFDVIVIGTGVAGQTAAGELATAGKRIAIADRREYGGTCALRGCEPKKVLYTAAEAVERANGHVGRGLAGTVHLDWPSLIAFKHTFTDPTPRKIEAALEEQGVVTLHGEARFVSADTLEIGDATYSAEHIVVATGAVPMALRIPGEELVADSETFMEAEVLPRRIAFIGGGYISFEFAHIAAAAGAEVSILHRSARVLKEFDADLADMLAESYRAAGIAVYTDAPVTAVRTVDDGLEVVLADGSTIECEMVVHGAGRTPDLDGLGLEAGDVAYGRRGIEVDEQMRSTTNPRVYAAGDAAAAGAPLTPVGIAQARIVVRNIVAPRSAVFEPGPVPSVAFSVPPLASVGMSPEDAEAAGLEIDVRFTDMTDWASVRRVGASVAGAKIVTERGTGRILGAHLLGPGADEVINVFAAAMRGGLTADDIRSGIWGYPTHGSDIVYLL